jgi:hypothetical protein
VLQGVGGSLAQSELQIGALVSVIEVPNGIAHLDV